MQASITARKIIFDMDGVITSEECYWNMAALVVWELLFSRRGLGLTVPPALPSFTPAPNTAQVEAIRRVIFVQDRVIAFFKQRAVNSNWDLAFYTLAFQLAALLNRFKEPSALLAEERLSGNNLTVAQLPRLGALLAARAQAPLQPDFEAILTFGDKGTVLLSPVSPLWEGVRHVFQEWYFGEAGYRELYGQLPATRGKRGFIKTEEPLLPAEKIKEALRQLRERGWVLGAATGRPRSELIPPLEQMGLLQYFDSSSLITFDHVEQAQQALAAAGETISLGKPHPFSLLRAYWGSVYADKDLFYAPFPAPPPGNCWLVGDAPADLLAARAAGVSFIAVRTGLAGAAGRDLFAGMGAAAVLPDMTHLPAYLADLARQP
jgi:phosphoglycolate phosphatase-like HAD superfamily hydrolase